MAPLHCMQQHLEAGQACRHTARWTCCWQSRRLLWVQMRILDLQVLKKVRMRVPIRPSLKAPAQTTTHPCNTLLAPLQEPARLAPLQERACTARTPAGGCPCHACRCSR